MVNDEEVKALLNAVQAAKSLQAARALVKEFAIRALSDRRKRVTVEARRRIMIFARKGMSAPAIALMLNPRLSAPTIRAIIREGSKNE